MEIISHDIEVNNNELEIKGEKTASNPSSLIPNPSLILGYYGFGNLGDELLLKACIKILNKYGFENEKLIVLSNNPEQTEKNFNIKSVNRWKISEVIKAMKESKFLILGGGGLFQDSTSIKSCFYYWGVVRLAKFFGLKIVALGQSVGPLKYKISKFLTGNALRICEKIYVRDENSFKIAEELGCKNLVKSFDLVLTLKPEKLNPPPIISKPLLIINLRPCKKLEKFINIIAPNLKKFNGKKIGVALSKEDEKILSAYKNFLGLEEIKLIKTFEEAENLWSVAYCAIGIRLHFGVLSRIFQTPVALMPYDIKVKEFAEQSNIPLIIDEWHAPSMPLPVADYDTI